MNSFRKFLFVVLGCCLVFTGCGKEKNHQDLSSDVKETTPSPGAVETTTSPAAVQGPEEEPADSHEGMKRSRLTGEWIPKNEAKKRPYAVMINNISFVSPYHSGLSQAGVIYEAVVEGGITRLLGIFENFNSEKIGSCRSARHYFASFADEYDAIFVHYGHTSYAINKIYSLGINNISGLSEEESVAFYRDSSLAAPHNAFASSEGLKKAAKQLGYRTEYEKDYRGHFLFNNEDKPPNKGDEAPKVSIFYSSYTAPYFEYNEKDGLYYNFQFGSKHMDVENNRQLCFKNIIIMLVKEWDIDSNGYQTMDIEHSAGEGFYITDNKVQSIRWEKNESEKTCFYTYENGKEIRLNPGKTYIGIVPSVNKEQISFK